MKKKTAKAQLKASKTYKQRMKAQGFYPAQVWIPKTKKAQKAVRKEGKKQRDAFLKGGE